MKLAIHPSRPSHFFFLLRKPLAELDHVEPITCMHFYLSSLSHISHSDLSKMPPVSNFSDNSPSISSSISQAHSPKNTFHIHSDCNMDIECLSLLERLPKELLWIIFGFAPESIFDLRSVRFTYSSFHNLLVEVKLFKTCLLIQSRVDEYALLSTRLVESLTFFEYRSIIRMEIHVPQNVSNIFELRLKLHQLPLRLEKRNPGRNECFNLNVSE